MEEKLLEMAWLARSRAYAPYSKFKVGAAIMTVDGDCFSGCNVEVANYGCTLCAERTAIVKAVSEGKLAREGLDMVVVAVETESPTAPCGSCRQMIEEFAHEETWVLLSNHEGSVSLRAHHRELLPIAFGPKHLE